LARKATLKRAFTRLERILIYCLGSDFSFYLFKLETYNCLDLETKWLFRATFTRLKRFFILSYFEEFANKEEAISYIHCCDRIARLSYTRYRSLPEHV